MKSNKVILVLISLMVCILCDAQPGSVCTDPFNVSVNQNLNGINYSFQNNEHVWIKLHPDSQVVIFQFLPDSISTTTNINGISLSSGNDCNSASLVWSKTFSGSDSITSNSAIDFKLLPSTGNYFLDIQKTSGSIGGFKLLLTYPEQLGGCSASCPNLIRNGGFDIYSGFCVGYSNNNICPNPFNNGCICGWGACQGTPSYNPPNNFAVLGAKEVINTDYGEGIFQRFQTPVASGKNYLLIFDYQNVGGVSGYNYGLHAQLTNSNFNATDCFEIIPGSGWDIPNTPLPATPNYTKVVRCFTSNADYSAIRFYPEAHSHSTEWVMVDGVSLEVLDEPLLDQQIYCGESANICIQCPSTTPAVHYLWSTGETTTCISVSPMATTIYTLTVSVVENGNTICSFNQTVTVVVNPPGPPTMIAGNGIICSANSGGTYCFDSPGATGYSYTVNPPNNMTANGNCLTVNWNNIPATCATIDVTASAGNCTATASFQVCARCQGNPSLLTFCDQTASGILNNPLYAPYISGGNVFTVPSGLWASIHGSLTIDVPFIFNNSDIRFGEDAKIFVNNFQVFEIINQCHLHSCDGINMWDGIYTEDPSAFVYIHDGSNLIEDAKNAIVSNNGGHFEINSTTFNNNYIGVRITAYTGIHTGKVWGCTFTGTGSLLKPYDNFCSMNYPNCGMYVDHVNHIQIGEPAFYGTYGRNLFQSMLCGIYSNGSAMDIFTSEFRNIIYPAANCTAAKGCGIFARGLLPGDCKINIGNNSISEKCIFEHCQTGIRERTNCYGDIISNSFTHCESGIVNLNSSDFHNLVKGNSFEDIKTGIYFMNAINQLQYGLEIYENTFNTGMTSFNPSTYGRTAIKVVNAVSASTNLWVVGNVINYSQVGIFVRNVWEPCQIRNNTINFDILPQDAMAIGRHHGIDCENDNGLEINSNYIRWKNQPNAPVGFINFMNGISVNYGTNGNAISGGISENKIGPYPAVNSGSIYGMGSGINISNDCSGLSLYCNKIARCEQGVTFNNVRLRQQGYQDQQLNWYSNGNTFSYTPGQGGLFRIGGTVLQLVDWAYIIGTESPNPFQFGTVLPHPTTFSMTHCQPPSPADEEIREDDFGSLIEANAQQLNPDFSGYEEQINYVSKEKFYAAVKSDSTILEAGTSDDIQYTYLYDQLDQTNIAKVQEVKASIDSKDYNLAMQKLLALVDTNLMEHNKKVAWKVFLETFACDSSMDSSHAALLEPISNMHPIIGGEGVFWACAMLDKEVNNDLPPLRKTKRWDVLSKESVVNIFPNPARNTLYVNYHCLNQLVLNIVDITGKTVISNILEVNADYHSINIASLYAGSYTVSAEENGKVICNEKLIIIR
ncbi:hypothetical protein BH11BAC1_BH11BAC1_05470 [soil metagenome]